MTSVSRIPNPRTTLAASSRSRTSRSLGLQHKLSWPISTLLLLATIGTMCTLPKFVTSFQPSSLRKNPSSFSATSIYAQQKQQQQEPSSASVRFSGGDSDASSLVSSDNPLDQLLAWLSSDIVSIVLGTVGLFLVVVHRLALLDDATSSSADALTSETRADLLAVFACGSVLLNGVTKLDVTAALAESVVLDGMDLPKVEFKQDANSLTEETKESLSWAMESLLVGTPAKSAVLISKANDNNEKWVILGHAGIIPQSSNRLSLEVPEKSPILDRVGSPGNVKETYLPTLQALPGRFEFSYLPSNTQLAVLVPVAPSDEVDSHNAVLVLGSNTAKSFTPRDIAWSRIAAERMGDYL